MSLTGILKGHAMEVDRAFVSLVVPDELDAAPDFSTALKQTHS